MRIGGMHILMGGQPTGQDAVPTPDPALVELNIIYRARRTGELLQHISGRGEWLWLQSLTVADRCVPVLRRMLHFSYVRIDPANGRNWY